MLKDLDNRQAEQNDHTTSMNMPIAPTSKSSVGIIVIIAISVVVTLAATYFWQMYQENTALKSSLKVQTLAESKQQIAASVNSSVELSSTKSLAVSKVVAQTSTESVNSQRVIQQEPMPAKVAVHKSIPKQSIPQQTLSEVKDELKPEPVGLTVEKLAVTTDVVQETVNKADENTTKLSITRRQLSPEQLSAKKMNQAELAMLDNDLAKAERLFEEILLILPSQQEARKQLAALWFGRKSYQPALNVLSQGIALAPNNSELRLMQARIYLKQGRNESAFNTLQQLTTSTSVEYQSLLANVAQQLGQTKAAISAYKTLTQLQPHIGRWWLGLAISYDGNSQFTLATQAYESALAQHNLSTSSTQFAQRRIVQLGE